jgi:peptide/nickel transport system permease protein
MSNDVANKVNPVQPGSAETGGPAVEDERHQAASQWQLVRMRFAKHKIAVASGFVLLFLYFLALFAGFLSPYSPSQSRQDFVYAPPTKIRFVDEDGRFYLRPFVYRVTKELDTETYSYTYVADTTERFPIRLFARGDEYRLMGLIPTDVHLFGVDGARVFLFGTDQLGRDLFSRVLYGARLSLSIGLVGVFLSFVLGLTLGGFSGYYGGLFDLLVQRLIEFLQSIPSIPLWMALSAALPSDWSIVQMYLAITVILSLIGWTGLARVVRGKFLSLRNEDFVTAARLSGTSEFRIVFQHMIPSFMSHIIASLTLAIPGMILAETALSFLGLGLRSPAISWGVLLQSAQNLQALSQAPWELIPGIFVIIAVLAFNFLGDGLRDAADPYQKM